MIHMRFFLRCCCNYVIKWHMHHECTSNRLFSCYPFSSADVAMLKSIWFIFKTEILIHIHRSKTWLYPLCFFFIVMILFPFAFTPDPLFLKKWIPGCIWIAALFSNLLSIDSFLLNDLEDSHLEQLLLSQLPLPFVLLIKL